MQELLQILPDSVWPNLFYLQIYFRPGFTFKQLIKQMLIDKKKYNNLVQCPTCQLILFTQFLMTIFCQVTRD